MLLRRLEPAVQVVGHEEAVSGFARRDPRGAVEMAGTPANPFGRTVPVTPQDGMMVVFPSWLLHWVRSYQGPGERISIAFNSRVDSLTRE